MKTVCREIQLKPIQKLCAWIKSHKNFEKNFAFLKEKMQPGLIIENTFSLVTSSNTSNSPGGITFTCKVCKKSVKLQVKVTGCLMLSNTHNHISARCWLNDNFDNKKKHLKMVILQNYLIPRLLLMLKEKLLLMSLASIRGRKNHALTMLRIMTPISPLILKL